MNKFPMLNNLRGLYAFIAVLILLGGVFIGFAIADSMNRSGADSGSGIAIFVSFIVSVALASTFLLMAELIGLALRIEDHLDEIRDSVKKSSYSPIPIDKSPSPVQSSKTTAIQLPIKDKYSETKSATSANNIVIDYSSSMELQVKAEHLNLYSNASALGDIQHTITNTATVVAFQRDSKGEWVFVEAFSNTKNSKVRGWVRVGNLITDFSQISSLPAQKE